MRLANGPGVWRVAESDGRRTGMLIGEALARAGDLTTSEAAIVTELLTTYESAFLISSSQHKDAAHGEG